MYTYIITNFKNTVFYTGVTNNIARRIYEHKNGIFINSFSKKFHLYKLIWVEEFDTPMEAITAEKMIKGWKRDKKIEMIKKANPNFEEIPSY
jgi:putative endonuclease